MLPQSEFESPMFASADARVAIAALTQDRALIGLLRSVVDPATDVILVTSEAELTPHLSSRRVSVALLDTRYVEGDIAGLAERRPPGATGLGASSREKSGRCCSSVRSTFSTSWRRNAASTNSRTRGADTGRCRNR